MRGNDPTITVWQNQERLNSQASDQKSKLEPNLHNVEVSSQYTVMYFTVNDTPCHPPMMHVT